MQIGEICIQDVICAERHMTVQQAAGLMRSCHVGNVIVVDSRHDGKFPIGIVTDRDIVVSVVAPGLDPGRMNVCDVMTSPLKTADSHQGVFETAEQMRLSGVRRLPVIDRKGALLGIVTVDDLLEFLTMHLSDLSRAITAERKKELVARP